MLESALDTRARRGPLRPLSVAPMMDRTDRHFRWFLRRMTKRTLLYTEMVTTGAVLHGNPDRHLAFDPEEKPLALQLGGDDPERLARCASIAEDCGYDEVNLNVGCPSDRVQRGSFGACLMKEPDRVARAVEAMRAECSLPVTVKHRIGVDDLDRYEDMLAFVERVAAAGCDRFSVHARKAHLKGLSPKDNRTVPPLRYEHVHRLKRERPDLAIEINGGFDDLAAAKAQLEHVDGVMIGRAAYDNPYAFSRADAVYFGDTSLTPPSREEVVEAMIPYAERALAEGVPFTRIARAMMHLFAGRPGARNWKRTLSSADPDRRDAALLRHALESVPSSVRLEV